MAGLLDLVSQQLSGSTVQRLSQQIGADPASTQKALSAALPLLVGGLARNANHSPQGAQSLARALERDHDGSVLDNLGGLPGGGLGSLLGGSGGGLDDLLGVAGSLLGGGSRATDGDGILGHVLGAKRSAIEQGVARSSGLSVDKVGRLLPLLAPIVMSALGRMKQQQNLDAGGLASMLHQERARVERDTPGMQDGGLLGFLDMDNDGDVTDDVAKIGGILGSFFGK